LYSIVCTKDRRFREKESGKGLSINRREGEGTRSTLLFDHNIAVYIHLGQVLYDSRNVHFHGFENGQFLSSGNDGGGGLPSNNLLPYAVGGLFTTIKSKRKTKIYL
jgi:hypothetical protein